MKLKELQKQFANHLYNQKRDKIFTEIKISKISPENRLQIYRNNVFGSFNSVLEIIYPITKKTIGDDYFYYLCKKYNQKYFSKSGNLDEYGKYFSQLINDLKNEHQLLYLKDLSRLEWVFHLAYFAKDVDDFALTKFQNLKEKDLFKVRFKLHPSCYLMASQYPIYSIWEFNKENIKGKLDLKKLGKETILIDRAKWQINISKLLEVEFLFLKKIKNKQNLYQIYQDLNEKFSDFDIGFLINKFISNGVISAYEL